MKSDLLRAIEVLQAFGFTVCQASEAGMIRLEIFCMPGSRGAAEELTGEVIEAMSMYNSCVKQNDEVEYAKKHCGAFIL